MGIVAFITNANTLDFLKSITPGDMKDIISKTPRSAESTNKLSLDFLNIAYKYTTKDRTLKNEDGSINKDRKITNEEKEIGFIEDVARSIVSITKFIIPIYESKPIAITSVVDDGFIHNKVKTREKRRKYKSNYIKGDTYNEFYQNMKIVLPVISSEVKETERIKKNVSAVDTTFANTAVNSRGIPYGINADAEYLIILSVIEEVCAGNLCAIYSNDNDTAGLLLAACYYIKAYCDRKIKIYEALNISNKKKEIELLLAAPKLLFKTILICGDYSHRTCYLVNEEKISSAFTFTFLYVLAFGNDFIPKVIGLGITLFNKNVNYEQSAFTIITSKCITNEKIYKKYQPQSEDQVKRCYALLVNFNTLTFCHLEYQCPGMMHSNLLQTYVRDATKIPRMHITEIVSAIVFFKLYSFRCGSYFLCDPKNHINLTNYSYEERFCKTFTQIPPTKTNDITMHDLKFDLITSHHYFDTYFDKHFFYIVRYLDTNNLFTITIDKDFCHYCLYYIKRKEDQNTPDQEKFNFYYVNV